MNDGSGNGATSRQWRRPRLVQAVLTTLADQENGSLPVKELFDELVERLQLGPEDLVSAAGGAERKFERDTYFDLIPAVKSRLAEAAGRRLDSHRRGPGGDRKVHRRRQPAEGSQSAIPGVAAVAARET